MVVIDTSVAYKWFSKVNESYLDKALELLEKQIKNEETLIAPDLILYELANAWATKTKLSLEQAKLFMNDFALTRVKTEPITFNLINEAMIFSKKYTVSVYDASYAVLAQEKECNYYTADLKFIKQVNLPFVKHLKDYN
jgi:predicted nucleic acid-binding protein